MTGRHRVRLRSQGKWQACITCSRTVCLSCTVRRRHGLWHYLQVREAASALSIAALSWTGAAPSVAEQQQGERRLPSPRIRGRRAERAASLAASIGLHVRAEDAAAARSGAGPVSGGVLAVALPWASAANPEVPGEQP